MKADLPPGVIPLSAAVRIPALRRVPQAAPPTTPPPEPLAQPPAVAPTLQAAVRTPSVFAAKPVTLPARNLPDDPKIVVAVRTWHAVEHKRLDLLGRTLASLVGADVVLVDNGSSDGTEHVVNVVGGLWHLLECKTFPALASGANLAGRGQNLAVAAAPWNNCHWLTVLERR